MDPEISQTGASPKSVWKSKQKHAQNTLSQPAQTLDQIVTRHKLRAKKNRARSFVARGLPMVQIVNPSSRL